MIITRAYKTKLHPTLAQSEYFSGCAGAARFVYNWALADRISGYQAPYEIVVTVVPLSENDDAPILQRTYSAGSSVNHYEQKRRFNALKGVEFPWILEYPYVVTESAFANLDTAYKNFFRRVRSGEASGFPKFKNRDSRKSFTLRGSIKVESDKISLPKIGWVELAEIGYLPTNPHKILSVTISKRADDWYISLQVEMDVESPERPEGEPIGVDFGYGVLAVTSDGTRYENPKVLDKHEKKLAKLQKRLAKQMKGGKNREKTKQKISKLHVKITDTRSHYQHNASKAIVDEGHAIIAVQKLAVKEMMQDKSPTNRYAKRSKKLADASLFELRRQIEYKQVWRGGEILTGEKSDASNKRCSVCGHINDFVGLQEEFTCESCGTIHDRRLNGAKNALHFVGL